VWGQKEENQEGKRCNHPITEGGVLPLFAYKKRRGASHEDGGLFSFCRKINRVLEGNETKFVLMEEELLKK